MSKEVQRIICEIRANQNIRQDVQYVEIKWEQIRWQA